MALGRVKSPVVSCVRQGHIILVEYEPLPRVGAPEDPAQSHALKRRHKREETEMGNGIHPQIDLRWRYR